MVKGKKNDSIFIKIYYLLGIVLLIFIVFMYYYSEDYTTKWCNKFVKVNSKIDRTLVAPKCSYVLDEILIKDHTNDYFCFPSNNNSFHFERDTITPFFIYEGKNKDGMDIVNANISKNSNIFRIITIGDSITEGYNVFSENVYPFLLEKKLVRNGKNVEVLNAAHGCYWIGNYYYLFKKIISEYDFDHIIFGINENDIAPCWEAIILREYLNEQTDFNSYTVKINEENLSKICKFQITPNYFNLNISKHRTLSQKRIYRNSVTLFEKLRPRKNYTSIYMTDNKEYSFYLNGIIDLIQDNNINSTFIIFPTKDYDKYNDRWIREELEMRNIDYIDIKRIEPKYLMEGCCGNERDPEDDNHPNVIGHKIITDILYEELKNKIN